MLDLKDTDVVRDWLVAAVTKPGKKPADLARHCEVSPQAVNGWLRTGRITKKNLEKATAFFGHGPSFTGSVPLLREPISSYGWPFKSIELSEVTALPAKRLLRLENLIRDRLDEWAEDLPVGHSAKKRSAR